MLTVVIVVRMTSKINFYSEANRQYNPVTHKYEGDTPLVFSTFGNVTDIGVNRSVEVFGKYDQQAKVVRLQSPVTVSWAYLTIDDQPTKYRLQTSRAVLKGNTLIVGEG